MKNYDREICILRQSQQKLALDLAVLKNVKVTVNELQRMTDVLVECCLRPMDDDLKKRVTALDSWLEKKSQKV